jgi:hypothetical protein
MNVDVNPITILSSSTKIICNVVESGAKHQHHPFFGEK